MCDYSLNSVPNRLARDGEELFVHRFETGSIGLASPIAADSSLAPADPPARTFWSALKEFFGFPDCRPAIAVCVPPGAALLLRDIPQRLQHELQVAPTEVVVFTQLLGSRAHRDAVRFQNGSEILLQRLVAGQRVRVLAFSRDGAQEPGDFREDENLHVPVLSTGH
jgi:hypothetical protein